MSDIRAIPLHTDYHKRYWLFVWPDYEPRGGMEDFHSAHDTEQGAVHAYEASEQSYNLGASIFDSETGENSLIS